MTEKTKFSDLVKRQNIKTGAVTPDEKVRANCFFSRLPEVMEAMTPYVICKKNPPSVLIEPVGQGTNQLKVANRWPAMALREECGSFQSKIDP